MKKVKLGQVATFINGYAFKPQDWSSEGKEIIRIQNLTKTSKGINYYSGTIDKKYIVEAGDILISWSGTLGVFQWCGRSAVLNQHIFKVVFDKIDIDKSYFKYVVEKGLQDAVKHTHGSTMKHLTKKYFDNIMVSYTNLREQQRIASELDLLSKLILRRQEQLEELNLLVKSRFNEMFGENKIFESIDNLFDIIDGDRGKNYPKSDELFSEEYCLFLNTKNVTKNGFSFDTKQFITKTKDKLLRKGKLERYDIVLTTRGTVGNVAYYDELIKYKHLRINSGMVILRPKTPNLNQKFIIHVLRNNNYSRVISGSAQPQLPITKLKKILLPLPPLALQNEFADFVALVDKSEYLFYFCQLYNFEKLNKAVTIPSLTKSDLLNISIPLPPLALQNEFADFVALVDKSQFACEIAIKVWRNSLKFSII
ncbi:type I RM modification enzyme [Streptococcus pneumoniae]|nr:type I RM modification enzyme [Streptococcus pneumoniae]